MNELELNHQRKFPIQRLKKNASAEEMRNKAMEGIGETKKRAEDDQQTHPCLVLRAKSWNQRTIMFW